MDRVHPIGPVERTVASVERVLLTPVEREAERERRERERERRKRREPAPQRPSWADGGLDLRA